MLAQWLAELETRPSTTQLPQRAADGSISVKTPAPPVRPSRTASLIDPVLANVPVVRGDFGEGTPGFQHDAPHQEAPTVPARSQRRADSEPAVGPGPDITKTTPVLFAIDAGASAQLARFGGGIVHDHLVPDGRLGKLRNPLLHEAITDLDDMLTKLNSYSTWGAQALHERGRRAGLGTALGHGAWTFIKTYFIRAGFLDGREGFMLAVSNAEGAYYKYLKLMLMERQENDRQ